MKNDRGMKRIVALLFACIGAILIACAVHAQEAQKSARAPGQPPDPRILEEIFACLAQGLPQDRKKAWFVMEEMGRGVDTANREFEANCFYATSMDDARGSPLTPCGAERMLEGVSALNGYLPERQRRGTGAAFSFTSEGRYDVKCDYTLRASTPVKPAIAEPAAKPATRKPGQGLRMP